MIVKSRTVCCAVARASKMLKGPTTLGIENPGKLKLKPKVCRLTVWLRSCTEPSRLGKNAARLWLTCVSDARTDCSARATRALPSGVSAISTARFRLNCMTPCARLSGELITTTSAKLGRMPFMVSVTPFGCRRAESCGDESHCPIHQRLPVRDIAYAISDFRKDSPPQHGVRQNADRKMESLHYFLSL